MRGAVLHAPGDVRVEERDDPTIVEPTDAVIRLSATCVCGSDLWPYRGIETVDRAVADGPRVRRHRRGGRRATSRTVKPGQFVVGSFFASDNTCEICRAGYQTLAACTASPWARSARRPSTLRVPLADGTLVATPDIPDDDLIPSLLAASDVLGTGWFGRRRRRGRARQDGRGRRGRRGRPARASSPPSSWAPSGSSR